jgi:hypothetical protein
MNRMDELDRALSHERGSLTRWHARKEVHRIYRAADSALAKISAATDTLTERERQLRRMVDAAKAVMAREPWDRPCFVCGAAAWCEHREPQLMPGVANG